MSRSSNADLTATASSSGSRKETQGSTNQVKDSKNESDQSVGPSQEILEERPICSLIPGPSDRVATSVGSSSSSSVTEQLSLANSSQNPPELNDEPVNLASQIAGELTELVPGNGTTLSEQGQHQKDGRNRPGSRGRSRRRGRRRGRRRRRGLQRARARARARQREHERGHGQQRHEREHVQQNAGAVLAELGNALSSSDSEDDDVTTDTDTGDPVGSADDTRNDRSRSPRRRRRSAENVDSRTAPGLVGPTLLRQRLHPTPCRVPNCVWSGGVDEAGRHARQAHRDAILQGAEQRLSVPLSYAAYSRYWRLIDAFDELFLVQFRRHAGSRRRLQAAVQLVGSAARAAQFYYLLHMQAVETPGQEIACLDNLPSSQSTNSNVPLPSTTRVSFVLGRTSSTRVDLEPTMISLWSAYNFSRPANSDSSPERIAATDSRDNSCNRDAIPRVLDLTLTIQRIEDEEGISGEV